MLLSIASTQYISGRYTKAIRQAFKINKSIQFRTKEAIVSVCSQSPHFIKNPTEDQNLPDEHSKVSGYLINISKPIKFLYTDCESHFLFNENWNQLS